MTFLDWLEVSFTSAQIGALFAYFCLLSLLLLLGKFLRVKVRFFQKILLPASVIAGFIGLFLGPFILGELVSLIWPSSLAIGEFVTILGRIRVGFYSLPARLIDIVFATMFLGIMLPSVKQIWKSSGPQMGYAMVVGGPMQYVVASLLAVGLLIPIFGVDPTFATLLEIGFCGGHGTAGGLQPLFSEGIPELGWSFPAGADLAFTSATVGILTATLVGIAMVNIGARKGYCQHLENPEKLPEEIRVGIIPPQKSYSISKATVAKESIEPLAFHLAIVFAAIFIGYGIHYAISSIGYYLADFTGNELWRVMDKLPTFPLAMLGGIFIQLVLIKTKKTALIDRATMERIQGLALEFLITSAIASISIPILIHYLSPFLLLMVVGIGYITTMTWFIAPRMLPNAWFERGMVEYGMQTGVTAMGIMLLRIIDPEFKTPALESFAFKQLVYELFFGGGFVTALTPILVLLWGLPLFAGVMFAITISFLGIAFFSKWFHPHPKPYR
jgi:ESS family glutamate:Na+ symporter